MLLNLNDPNSIFSWWQVLPERHGAQLLAFARLRPQFAWPIRMAVRRIKSDPELKRLFEQGLREASRDQAHAVQRLRDRGEPVDTQLAA